MNAKVPDVANRNSVYLNSYSELNRFIATMSVRCLAIEDHDDLLFFKSVQTELIQLAVKMEKMRGKN